eukprot:INCI10588.1.p1 GENE.INCI10588.1~~INCI10588.1.p1  ORF type:complete len:183 (+),score=24.49 INCI10588.1:144-692(+)
MATAEAVAPKKPVLRVFTPRERRLNREAVNERCLRKLNPDLKDFQRIGHTAVYRYIDYSEDKGPIKPRWLDKRTEGQLFVVRASVPDGPESMYELVILNRVAPTDMIVGISHHVHCVTKEGNYVTMLYENGQLDTFWFYDVACVKTLFDIVQSVIEGRPTEGHFKTSKMFSEKGLALPVRTR